MRMGSTKKKILLCLGAGLVLSLTRRPDYAFKIIKNLSKELERINQQALRRAIKNLYQSKLVKCLEDENGNIQMILSEEGKKQTLNFNLDNIEIEKPKEWNEKWHLVIFDIPEKYKQGRDALSFKLRQLGFYPLQKSVYIFPYECKDEIDFIVELFNLKPFARYLVVEKIDIGLDLKNHFKLL